MNFKEIILEKIVINICVGNIPERLENAKKILKNIFNQNPVGCRSKTVSKDFGIKKNMIIGYKITLRKNLLDFLKKCLEIKKNTLYRYCFDPRGNFSFGINNHTLFKGQIYTSDIGIFGMDVNISFIRRGYRINKRKLNKKKIPKKLKNNYEQIQIFLNEKIPNLKIIL